MDGQAAFRNRADAGRQLVGPVSALGLIDPLLLALPRGGVAVAAALAEGLGLPPGRRFDVLVARKIGAPGRPELGLGAVAEGGGLVVDKYAVARFVARDEILASIVREERAELARRVAAYRGGRPLPDPHGRAVVLIDDGLATGGTARAALRALATLGAARRVLAVPVGPADVVRALQTEAEDVVCLHSPTYFRAVSVWYDDFAQLTDEDVLRLLGGDEDDGPG